MKQPTSQEILKRFEQAYQFNQSIGLYDTVEVNENFFIGNQWEGVQSNGLPTPVFNFLKRVVLFQVATITSDNLAIQASVLPSIVPYDKEYIEKVTEVLNHQYAEIIERNRIVAKMRELLRNAAVDGDGCMYFRFDPTIENGQKVKGEIVAEVIENTRCHFGNPNSRDVQTQPWIIISKRALLEDVQYDVEQNKKNGTCDIEPDDITADSEKFANKFDQLTDDKVTVLTYLYRNRETKTIWACEVTEAGMVRNPYDTKLTLYPIVWLNWDYRHDCYHGQAMITGLIPNQKFINKMFAMSGVSMLTMAFPKIVFDKNRIKAWTGAVGAAVGVNGNVDNVAKIISGASMDPQLAQFMEMCIHNTQTFLGASDVAMGDSRPDNTSAIIALQRAANTPMEMTKQASYQCNEDMARIWEDMMRVNYGKRIVDVAMPMDRPGKQPFGMKLEPMMFTEEFNFADLGKVRLAIKQDVGASSYWSEIANMQTLDNLLMNKQITLKQYLERIPSGFIAKPQELIADIEAMSAPSEQMNMGTGMSKESIDEIAVEGGSGNGELQRALNAQGA